MNRKLYQMIASLVQAADNCVKSGNAEWQAKHEEMVDSLVSDHMPSGSGFDNGTEIDWSASTAEKLVFNTGFHHMDENGMYSGWTDHTVIVTASLASGFDLRVTGRDRNDIKAYIAETFGYALEMVVDQNGNHVEMATHNDGATFPIAAELQP